MKEGRATLMGLRRAVAGTAGHGNRFLLAFDRGRSRSCDLLCLCRRAAALCIGADVSWFFDTWRPGVIPRTKGLGESIPGFGRARFMRSSAQPPAPQHVSRALGVQVRVNQEPGLSVLRFLDHI